jgi:hypothetical protein
MVHARRQRGRQPPFSPRTQPLTSRAHSVGAAASMPSFRPGFRPSSPTRAAVPGIWRTRLPVSATPSSSLAGMRECEAAQRWGGTCMRPF